MDAKLTTIIVMVAAAVFVFWGMLYPKFNEVRQVKDEINIQVKEKIKVRASVDDIHKKIAVYESLSGEDLEFLDKALPKNDDLANLYVHINSLVVSSGLTTEDISISDGILDSRVSSGLTTQDISISDQIFVGSEGDLGGSAQASSALAYYKVPVEISAVGSYESLKEFILKTENTLRIMDVSTYSFSSGSDSESSSNSFSFEIEAAVYYRP